MRPGGAYRRKLECWEASKDYERVETAVVGAIQGILRRVSETRLSGGPESNDLQQLTMESLGKKNNDPFVIRHSSCLQQLTMKSLSKERDLSGTVVNRGNCVFGNQVSAR